MSEVVVQGVRRFSAVRRFPLQAGYNVIYGLNESGKSTVYDVLRSLLFARPAEGEQQAFASWMQGVDACRAGLTLQAGGQLFRLLKDYGSGKVSLSKYDAPNRKFVLMLDQGEPIRRWLTDALQVPAGPDFGRLFTIERDDVPSSNVSAGAQAATPGIEFEQKARAMSLPEKKESLDGIIKEFRSAGELRTLEMEQDDVVSRLDEIENTLRQHTQLDDAVKQAQAAWEEVAMLPALPADIEEKVAAFEDQTRERDSKVHELGPQYDQRVATQKPPLEPWKDPLALGGAGAAFVGLILTAVLTGGATYVGVGLLLLGFGLAGWRVFEFFRSQETYQSRTQTARDAGEKLRLVEKTFEIETAVVRGFMKQYKVDNPEALLQIAADRATREQAMREARARLDQFTAQHEIEKARRERDLLQDRRDALERRVSDLGGGGNDPFGGVEADKPTLIARAVLLEGTLAGAEGRSPRPPSALFGDESIDDDRYATVGADPTSQALERYCAARNADKGTLLRAIQEVFNRNVEAFTGGVWPQAMFDASGHISVRQAGGQQPAPLHALSVPEQDAVYAALRFTLFQLESRSIPPIVLLDDPFDFDEGRMGLLGRALKTLGQSGQVLHFTSDPSLRAYADHAVEL